MTRSHVKYQIARDDVDTTDYLPQNISDFQNVSKLETSFWRKVSQALLLISLYFVLSVGLTFYQPWLYNTYVSNCTSITLFISVAIFVIRKLDMDLLQKILRYLLILQYL